MTIIPIVHLSQQDQQVHHRSLRFLLVTQTLPLSGHNNNPCSEIFILILGPAIGPCYKQLYNSYLKNEASFVHKRFSCFLPGTKILDSSQNYKYQICFNRVKKFDTMHLDCGVVFYCFNGWFLSTTFKFCHA